MYVNSRWHIKASTHRALMSKPLNKTLSKSLGIKRKTVSISNG